MVADFAKALMAAVIVLSAVSYAQAWRHGLNACPEIVLEGGGSLLLESGANICQG